MVKRIRKPTILSMVLMSVGIFLMFLMFYTGNLVIGGAGLILFVLGLRSRKRESFDEYRDRYNERYGIDSDEES